MTKLIEFNGPYGLISIPVDLITGFSQTTNYPYPVFIATGPSGGDGGENGWYVKDSYEIVKTALEKSLEGR